MFSIDSKYGEVKIFARTIEDAAVGQVTGMVNSPLGENAHVRIMPDAHAGMGCVIGTTMRITDKVCPNLVGVDIGCGVALLKVADDLSGRLDELDAVIRAYVPFGMQSHDHDVPYLEFENLRCWDALTDKNKALSQRSLGTLGGGNHFIESYDGGCISVHCGSRNIGNVVAKHYQDIAEKNIATLNRAIVSKAISETPPQDREGYIHANKISVDKDLSFLTGDLMDDYLHDIKIIQEFAKRNRAEILKTIANGLRENISINADFIECVHNYIDTDEMILRKGAISAKAGEQVLIPLNMRDGMLVCVGKGNDDWNQSAPHGAGRIYSRTAAKAKFSLDKYAESMSGIYTTCVNESTIDEAPFVYKDMQEIIECVADTVEIHKRLIPIFNFKAN